MLEVEGCILVGDFIDISYLNSDTNYTFHCFTTKVTNFFFFFRFAKESGSIQKVKW